jgi:hypothetical protein
MNAEKRGSEKLQVQSKRTKLVSLLITRVLSWIEETPPRWFSCLDATEARIISA